MARMESTRNTYDSRMDSSRTDDSYADYDENDLNATPRGYPRGREVTPRREDSRGQMMPPRDASGRFIPVYPKGQRARSYYKARQVSRLGVLDGHVFMLYLLAELHTRPTIQGRSSWPSS